MAARFPEEWIEELRNRADIVSVVSEYVQLKQKGRDHWGLCPFHAEKTPSFKVNPEQGFFYCFGCKAGGTVFQFIMSVERMDFAEAVRYLADKIGMPLPTDVDPAEAARNRSLREHIQALNRQAAHYYHETLYAPAGAEILAYLHDRGLDDPMIRMFGLGAAPAGWDTLTKRLLVEGATPEALVSAGLTIQKENRRFDMFRDRAIFPIINAHGSVLGFGGRAMGDAQPKYLNTADTPLFNKRHNVYAANLLRKAKGLSRVLLVEGYMDVVSLTRYGISGVAATLGTSLTSEQAKLLYRYAPEIWIVYDGDSAGQNATMRALDILESLDMQARVLVIPEGKDPDDFIRQYGVEAFNALPPLSPPIYRMQRIKETMDLSSEEGRTQYAIQCAAILKAVKQPVELDNLLKRLSIETGYTKEVLVRQMGVVEAMDKKAYKAPSQRIHTTEKVELVAEHNMAERLLLSMINAGYVEEGVVDAERFVDPMHRHIAESLLGGKHAAELLDSCEDDNLRAEMLEIFGNDPQLSGAEAIQIVTDCLERMRRGWVESRIQTLSQTLREASGQEKAELFAEIVALNKEKGRLRPGRKE